MGTDPIQKPSTTAVAEPDDGDVTRHNLLACVQDDAARAVLS